MFPPRSHEHTVETRVPTSPSGPGTRPSGGAGPLTPDSLLGVGEGSDRVARDAIRARLFPDLRARPSEERLARIGRYAVLRRIGEGGMGVVFAAYDEELDRRVAIKLLRGRHRDDERSRTRMLREAQALARVSHPHVVHVFEVGLWGDEVYLAMEYVPGETLRRWLRHPHPWREVLDVLVQAGRGLAAAHAAELVHRDFKPDNVMVADDGRVRVLDFGLVRAANHGGGDSLVETDEGEAKPDPFAEGITRTGSLLGTPNYMAPERLGPDASRGADDARCDQFSFCATAYEALFGQRPFAGDSLIELMESLRGEPRPIPRDSPVPRRVSAAILRGLAHHSSQRWPSMAALLDELEHAVGRRRSPWPLLAAGGLAGALLVGGLALGWSGDDREAPSCASIDEAALRGTWDGTRRSALRRAIAATELPHAAATGQAVEQALDRWSSAWLVAQQDACVATHEQHVQSEAVLDQRQRCLGRQARRVEGLLAVFATPDAAVLERSGEWLARLPDPRSCLLVDTLAPVRGEAHERLEGQLAAVEGLIAVGKLERARGQLQALGDELARLGDVELELRAAGLQHELDWGLGFDPAVASAWRASADAARLAGLVELETDLRVRLAVVAVRRLPDLALERWLIDDAALALELGDEHDSARAHVLRRARIQLLEREGKFDEAQTEARALLAELAGSEHAAIAGLVRQTLANVEAEAGELEQAGRDYAQARVELAASWGAESPAVAVIDHDLALLALDRGELDEAERLLARAEAIHRSNPGSLALADDRAMRVTLALYRGELDDAGVQARAAVEVYARELGPDHETTLHAIELRGIVRYFEGDFSGSLADYEHVLPGYLAIHGPNDVFVGVLHVNRGDSLLALGRADAALHAYVQAHAILAALAHPLVATALAGRGEALLALGRVDEAITDLEQALAGIEPGEQTELAEARFALARALAARGGEPDRVAELSDQARATFESLGLTTQRESLDRWRGR